MTRRSTVRGIWRILRPVAIIGAVLAAIPMVLTPLYLVVDPISVPMLERYITARPVVRDWRDLDDISDRLKAAVVMSEDGQFCLHFGGGAGALQDEVANFMAGREARGASTITMQVARNLFLWNGQSVVRKALEVPLASWADLVLGKRRLLEIYLNVVEWGPGIFGVEAAAHAERTTTALVSGGDRFGGSSLISTPCVVPRTNRLISPKWVGARSMRISRPSPSHQSFNFPYDQKISL